MGRTSLLAAGAPDRGAEFLAAFDSLLKSGAAPTAAAAVRQMLAGPFSDETRESLLTVWASRYVPEPTDTFPKTAARTAAEWKAAARNGLWVRWPDALFGVVSWDVRLGPTPPAQALLEAYERTAQAALNRAALKGWREGQSMGAA